MSTRRKFLHGTSAALAAAALPLGLGHSAFAQAGRTRASVTSASGKANLKILAEAVGIMRGKPAGDPLSWERQVTIHSKGGTLRMHGCWRFFPWHRVQLACFEAIVEKVTGKAFALPYWDAREHKTIPAEFFDRTSNLHDDRRFGGVTEHTDLAQRLKDEAGRVRPTRLDSDFNFFHGGADVGQYGSVDFFTHGAIHGWVGGIDAGGNRGDFSSPPTATRDPFFWLHHSNIDRVWESWQRRPGAADSSQYPAAFLAERLEHEFAVSSVPLQPVTTKDVLVSNAMPFGLGYSYDHLYSFPSFAPPPGPPGWEPAGEDQGPSQSSGTAVGDAGTVAVLHVPIASKLRPVLTGDKRVHLADCRALIRVGMDTLPDYNLRIYVDTGNRGNLQPNDDTRFCTYVAPFISGDHAGHGDAEIRVDVTKQVNAAFERGATDGIDVIVQPVSKGGNYKPTTKVTVTGVTLDSTVIHLKRA